MAVALGCALSTSGAGADTFPSRPIRMLVPYAAGGTTDIMARALQETMHKELGQVIVVENKAGAAGTIAMQEAARAPADGHTIVFINNGLVATTPVLQKDAGFDGIRDFAPIGMVANSPMMVVVNAQVPVTDLKGFIGYARQNPGKLNYASAGPGSFGHLSSELFLRAAGLDMAHVPYKGQGPTVNAVLAGEVQLLITSPSASMQSQIAAGKLKLLGVGTTERWPLAPEAPTVSSVLPDYNAESWFAILAPAGTPKTVVAKLNGALNKALAIADIQTKFNNYGLMAVSSSPDELRDRIAVEVRRWGDVIRKSGIKLD
jgi:tripartite-type tricarboxylate transporter receptor subunit TctC